MTEPAADSTRTISQERMLAAIHCHEDMREFFLAMFEQNAHLRRTAGRRVNDMLTPLAELHKRPDLVQLAAYLKRVHEPARHA